MKDIIGAIEAQKTYVKDDSPTFLEILKNYGYEDYKTFSEDKRNYLIEHWNPEVFRWDMLEYPDRLEQYVQDRKYGVYISETKGTIAIHGSDYIDYNLCKEMNVFVIEIPFLGGTGISSEKDLVIQILVPEHLGWETPNFLNKFYEIISKYENNVTISNNDILINNKKVLGSMQRRIDNKTFLWGAWVSFGNYDEIIEKICHKKSVKKPGHFNNLTKEVLEKEILNWLNIE